MTKGHPKDRRAQITRIKKNLTNDKENDRAAVQQYSPMLVQYKYKTFDKSSRTGFEENTNATPTPN
jgi:hypothetical protein